MSPRIFSCVLCGSTILDKDTTFTTWRSQFRLLYSGHEGIAVSGVGLYNDPRAGDWIAPTDYAARWNDAGYSFPASDKIGVFWQPPVNGRHGFPFHEACWSLLGEAYCSRRIPFEALFGICKSLPMSLEGPSLDWGHDFGGLFNVGGQPCYSWEKRFVRENQDWTSTAMVDPYYIPEISDLPLQAVNTPRPSFGTIRETRDCFTVLPLEIRIAIASYLSTVDALTLRRASSSFLPIIDSQQFWASRFWVYAERSWLFESQQWDKSHDWRALYRHTHEAHRSRGMQNRVRIWKLVQSIRAMLRLEFIEPASSRPGGTPINGTWSEATGNLRPGGLPGSFHEGCRRFYEQQTTTSSLSSIGFSVIQLGDAEYITGLRLTYCRGEPVQLGYRSVGTESSITSTTLLGFNLTVGSRGIQGLQCILHDGQTSPSVGDYHAPRTKRLALYKPITAIKAGFDGFKMVSLAVTDCLTDPLQPTTEPRQALRDSAIWFPRIPSLSLSLNEGYFAARHSITDGFQPLCWTSFGGPRGRYLRYLTGVSAMFRGSLFRGLTFHYNISDVPLACRQLGRDTASEAVKTKHFVIDGPGGEIITNVGVCISSHGADRHGLLISFKIWTNRKKSCYFRIRNSRDTVRKKIMIAPGTTPTGFYCSQDEKCVTAIGVISERISEV